MQWNHILFPIEQKQCLHCVASCLPLKWPANIYEVIKTACWCVMTGMLSCSFLMWDCSCLPVLGQFHPGCFVSKMYQSVWNCENKSLFLQHLDLLFYYWLIVKFDSEEEATCSQMASSSCSFSLHFWIALQTFSQTLCLIWNETGDTSGGSTSSTVPLSDTALNADHGAPPLPPCTEKQVVVMRWLG